MAGNNFQRAEAALLDELRMAPSAWAYSFLGTLRMLQGRHPEARQAMATAMQIGPVVAAQRHQNAAFLSSVGQSQRALVEFSSVLLLDPNTAGAYYGVAVESARLGQTAQAIQAYETYLKYDSTSQLAQLARLEISRLRNQGVPNPSGFPTGPSPFCPPGSFPTTGGCAPIR
jgi:predicted Zn-dependent protease